MRTKRKERLYAIKRLLVVAHSCVQRQLCGERTTREERRALKAVVVALRYLKCYEPEIYNWERQKGTV